MECLSLAHPKNLDAIEGFSFSVAVFSDVVALSGVGKVVMTLRGDADVTSLSEAREPAAGRPLMKLDIDSVSDFCLLWDTGVIGDCISSATFVLQQAKLFHNLVVVSFWP